VVKLKNGLVLSEDKSGFESFNHLTNKIDKGSYVEFTEMPDIFYKELGSDDRALLTSLSSEALALILERTRTIF
jgi:hypothetical protein